MEAFFRINAADVKGERVFGQIIFRIDGRSGFADTEFGKIDAVTEGLDGDTEFMAVGDEVMDGYFGGHSSVGAFFQETGEIVTNDNV